ncbi:MAG: outer membrane beta-barrel protein [Saprospiraceae bacterium]|jgi:hypothetical protein|nr:outer membrane beta-barrel protein [Saprospiraceae bacterium]MBL0025909.1 outer membrane beta-barrel protein [Saprospiraceae bacterium]
MNRYFLAYFAVFTFILQSADSFAQKGLELGGWLGTSFYFGDLNTTLKITKPGLAGGILARYNFNNRVSVRTSLNYGRVGADDADSKNNFEFNRNLSFKSNIFDLANVIEFNFFHYEHGHQTFNKTPYFFGGFNVLHFNPTAVLDGQTYHLREFGTEGQAPGSEYSQITFGFVLGGGLKFDLNRTTSINIELSTRILFTDYLDDVSSVFPDKTELLASRGETAVKLSDRSLIDGLGSAGRQRGDTKGKDKYSFAGISIVRYFGGITCPDISRIR